MGTLDRLVWAGSGLSTEQKSQNLHAHAVHSRTLLTERPSLTCAFAPCEASGIADEFVCTREKLSEICARKERRTVLTGLSFLDEDFDFAGGPTLVDRSEASALMAPAPFARDFVGSAGSAWVMG